MFDKEKFKEILKDSFETLHTSPTENGCVQHKSNWIADSINQWDSKEWSDEEKSRQVDFVFEHVTYKLIQYLEKELGEHVIIPKEITSSMQHAYFDVIDRNMDRVTTDATFGRSSRQKEAYRAMIAAYKNES